MHQAILIIDVQPNFTPPQCLIDGIRTRTAKSEQKKRAYSEVPTEAAFWPGAAALAVQERAETLQP
ncbi:hypothetical protein [Pseudomonas fluorescens]|uniref:Uncharacterized protein n=1 Tax=Pseudomonas fluorescens TaxID=294 RepID=A0A5E7ECX1_PSEFL|nr:hypothetical protein [Pseudomonas fluorescens]VVO24558.1 hypothetical protein PS710_04519 [Pseudomonas fluorescens]